MEFRGARYIHIFVPCPLGWGHASHDTIRIARLAKETGLFPVFEAEHGEVTQRLEDPQAAAGRGVPASRRSASRTCSARQPRTTVIARIQAIADRNIRTYGLLETRSASMMRKPFAITLDPGSSLANHTGTWRTERPVYVDRLPPCNHACPAGENIQGWLYHAESGDYEAAWRQLIEDNPLPAVMGRVCYHPCETLVQPRQPRFARSASIRSSASSATRRSGAAGSSSRRRRAPASACWSSAPGPRACRPPITSRASGTRSTIHDAGPVAGGMMRFGIPKYRLPRDVLDAEVQRIVDLGVELRAQRQGRRTSSRRCSAGAFDAAFLAVGAHIAKRAYIPAGSAAKILDAVSVLRSMEGEDSSRCSAGAWWSTAAATPRSTSRAPPSASARARRSSSTGARASRMPAHDFEVEEALQEGVMIKWLSTIKQAGDVLDHGGEDGARREGLSAADRRVRDARRPTRWCSRSARTWTCRCSTACRASRSRDGVVKVGADMMTGHAGIFAGGDMVPAERTVTVAVGHGKKAARHIDAWLRGAELRGAAQARAGDLRASSTPGTTRTRRRRVRPVLDIVRRQSTFDEV